MQYYQFHIGDYTTATVHLNHLEDLAYRRLLDLYYMTEEPIPTDIPLLSRRLRMDAEPIEIILNEFFEYTEEGWKNSRCDTNITEFHDYIDKQKANGKKGGRPRKNPSKTSGKPTANPSLTHGKPTVKPPITHNPEPITQEETPKPPRGAAAHDAAICSIQYPECYTKDLKYLFTEFADMRRGNRKYMTAKAVEAHFRCLEGYSPSEIAKAYNEAIAAGWQSVHPKTTAAKAAVDNINMDDESWRTV